jgi:hypothetical protein
MVLSTKAIPQEVGNFYFTIPQNSDAPVFPYIGDVGSDIDFVLGEKSKEVFVRPQIMWPGWVRRCAVIDVKNEEFGDRTFLVFTDSLGNFLFLPRDKLDDPDLLKVNGNEIPRSYFREVSAASYYPTGAILPGPDNTVGFPRFRFDCETMDWQQGYPSGDIHPWFEALGHTFYNLRETSLTESQVRFGLLDSLGLIQQHIMRPGFNTKKEWSPHQPLFHFSSDGKTAVAIVNHMQCEEPLYYSQSGHDEEVPTHTWAKMWSVNGLANSVTVSGPLYGRAILDESGAWRAPGSRTPYDFILSDEMYRANTSEMGELYNIKPRSLWSRALLEVSIGITITGPLLDQYTASVTRKQYDSSKQYVAADYAYDNKHNRSVGVNGGDLVVSYLENRRLEAEGFTETDRDDVSRSTVFRRGLVGVWCVTKKQNAEDAVYSTRLYHGPGLGAYQPNPARVELDGYVNENNGEFGGTSLHTINIAPDTFTVNGGAVSEYGRSFARVTAVDLRALTMCVEVHHSERGQNGFSTSSVVLSYGEVLTDPRDLYQHVDHQPNGTARQMREEVVFPPYIPTPPGEIFYNYYPLLEYQRFGVDAGYAGTLQTHPDGHVACTSGALVTSHVYIDAVTSGYYSSPFYQWTSSDKADLANRAGYKYGENFPDIIRFWDKGKKKWNQTTHLETVNKALKKAERDQIPETSVSTGPMTIDGVDMHRLCGWSVFTNISAKPDDFSETEDEQ